MGSPPHIGHRRIVELLLFVGINAVITREDTIMTSIMRRTVRGAATGLGALAIVAGASACGGLLGGGDEEQEPQRVEEEEAPAEDEGAGDAAADESGEDAESDEGGEDDAAASEGGEDDAASDGGDAAGALSDDDLSAGSERFIEFLHTLDDDGAEACGFILDPTTGAGMSDEAAEACGPAITSGFEQQGTELQPGMFDTFDASMIELTDNGDGTAAVSLAGTDMGMNMVTGDDGQWYIEAPVGTV